MEAFVDSNGNAINLWELAKWHRTNNDKIGGHIWPLKSTGDLVAAVLSRQAVMIGFGGKSAGHTVLVTGIKYTPRVIYHDGYVIYTDQSIIRDIRVLDPMTVDRPEYWLGDMDKFFLDYRFGFALTDGITTN